MHLYFVPCSFCDLSFQPLNKILPGLKRQAHLLLHILLLFKIYSPVTRYSRMHLLECEEGNLSPLVEVWPLVLDVVIWKIKKEPPIPVCFGSQSALPEDRIEFKSNHWDEIHYAMQTGLWFTNSTDEKLMKLVLLFLVCHGMHPSNEMPNRRCKCYKRFYILF